MNAPHRHRDAVGTTCTCDMRTSGIIVECVLHSYGKKYDCTMLKNSDTKTLSGSRVINGGTNIDAGLQIDDRRCTALVQENVPGDLNTE